MKTIYLTDEFLATCGVPEQVPCFVTGEPTHYFDMYHNDAGEPIPVEITLSNRILDAVSKRKGELSIPLVMKEGEVEFQVIDTRYYKSFYETWNHPDYVHTELENDERWLWNLPPEWEKANENNEGIQTIAFKRVHMGENGAFRIVGYNGVLEGDKVQYEGKEHTVVMVSRLGDFGLSTTGALPYEIRVRPDCVKKAS